MSKNRKKKNSLQPILLIIIKVLSKKSNENERKLLISEMTKTKQRN